MPIASKKPLLLILIYHNFFDQMNESFWSTAADDYMCTYERFDQHIEYLLNYPHAEFITPDEFFRNYKELEDKVYIYLTFDDGYYSSLAAFKKLRSHSISAAASFINSALVDTFELAWPEKLLCFFHFLNNKDFAADISMTSWKLSKHTPFPERKMVFLSLVNYLKGTKTTIREQFLQRLYNRYQFDIKEFSSTGFYKQISLLSWNDIKWIADNGFTIGGHTATHPILSQCESSRIAAEIVIDKQSIESHLGKTISLFAIPNGKPKDYNIEVLTTAKSAGYKYILSTTLGYNRIQHRHLPLMRYDVGNLQSQELSDVLSMARTIQENKQ